jgi:UDP:flavonoid glycosyltransferase YjiC (YdhE family)
MPNRRRILFIGEGVTLAHVTRPYLLARALDPERYEVFLATPPTYTKLLDTRDIRLEPLTSIPSEQFLRVLSRGRPLYNYATLSRYLQDDLELLDRIKPDLVVGDFRLSLAVSAPLAGVPYAALTNAHWSPYAAIRQLPIPEHISVHLFGVRASQFVFDCLQPAILATHARPLNQLRKRHGLPPLGDLRETYTYGDHTLYLDTPGLIPTHNLPKNHHYLGPAIWSPDIPLPEWWKHVPEDRPTIYVTLGSSGQVNTLPSLLEALSSLLVNVIVATAGRAITDLYSNCYSSEYLPGIEAAKHANLVICNGGSATVYQALAQGTPVLGIPANLDQHLTMAYVTKTGAGISIRSDMLSTANVRQHVITMLQDISFHQAARGIAMAFAEYDCRARFINWLDEVFKPSEGTVSSK